MAPKKNADLPQKKPVNVQTLAVREKIISSGTKPPKIQRRVTSQRKIELANEVALSQLQTKSLNSPPKQNSSAKLTPALKELTNPVDVKRSTPKRKRKSAKEVPSTEEIGSEIYPLVKKATNTIKRKPAAKICKNENTTQPVLKTPTKRKLIHAIDDEIEPGLEEPIKKRPGPKSKTTPQTKKKKAAESLPGSLECNEVKIDLKPVSAKAKNGPRRKQQQKIPDINGAANVEPTVVLQEIPSTPARRVWKKKKPALIKPEIKKKGPEKEPPVTIAKKTRGKPKAKLDNERCDEMNHTATTRSKAKGKTQKKGLNAEELKAAASMLENAIKIEPAKITIRPNSLNSTNSNLSWTKDISTASSATSETTTCVTVSSNDIVCFDNKLPYVKVDNNILERLKSLDENKESSVRENESSSSSSDSDSDSSSDSELDLKYSKPGLNLSTSSLTSKSPQSEGIPDNTELLGLGMDKLKNSLENFYTEMRKWIVRDQDDSCSFTAILETMNLEKDVISNCENFKSMLDAVKCPTEKSSPVKPSLIKSDRNDSNKTSLQATRCSNSPDNFKAGSPERTDRKDSNTEFVKPRGVSRMSIAKKQDSHVNLSVNVPKVSDVFNPPNETTSEDTFTNDNYKYLSFDKTCDDDDALSIFAESITESSRRGSVASISNLSQDAYVPKPTSRSWMQEKYVYNPTRIDEFPTKIEDEHVTEAEPPLKMCDSSSVCHGTQFAKDTDAKAMENKSFTSLADPSLKKVTESELASQQRLFALYKPVQNVKSLLYRGYCFFYVAFQCKNIHCRFPHVDIDRNLFKCRLALLNEDNLIEEYLLARSFPVLRRKFGSMFIEECKRRKATRILMEMAIELGLGVVEGEDENLIVNVLETTLLHLNSISLDACDDQLKFEHKNIMMCDALLLCMANSQNFAQFKRAFAKLALFMWEIKRPVDIELVASILERVCILPGEELLSRGMLNLMKNTDVCIFENSLTKSFEVQLSNIESDVYESYLMAKRDALKSLLVQTVTDSSPATPDLNHVDIDRAQHTSPDSTNTDRMHIPESTEPTTFKCTIDTEAIKDIFKAPSNPVSIPRYGTPRVQDPWRRGMGYRMRGTVRLPVPGLARRGPPWATSMPTGRRVNRTPLVCTVSAKSRSTI